MNYKIILYSLGSIFFSNALYALEPGLQLKGAIRADGAIDYHSYILHFNGQQTRSNKSGFYTFLPGTQTNFDTISLLVCRDFMPKFTKGNSIKQLISNPERYRYFVLKKNPQYPATIDPSKKNKLKPEEGFWIITEEKLTDDSVIPTHCISILVDPKFFKEIENWPIKLEANIIPLPRLVLKNKQEMIKDKPDRAEKKGYIREASFWSDSNAITTRPFHKKLTIEKREAVQGKTKIETHTIFEE